MNLILKNKSYKILLILFFAFYVYSLLAGILFQKLLPHILPGMVAPGASLTTDSAYFHQIAANLANDINAKGWSVWSPFPNQYTSFNVALLGALYALFGVNSILAVPLNAVFHALSGILLYLIAIELSADRENGKVAGLVISVAFVVFPSALNWYGQIHKDGYAIFGVFLYAYTLVFFVRNHKTFLYPKVLECLLYNFISIFFIGIIRPYYLKPLLIFSCIFVLVSIFCALLKSDQAKKLLVFATLTTLFVVANSKLVVIIGATEAQLGETYAMTETLAFQKSKPRVGQKFGFCNGGLNKSLGDVCDKYSVIEDQIYLYYSILDEQLENNAKILAETRFKLNEYSKNVKSKSSIDVDVNFYDFNDVISYVPRALQISIFAPFPNTWFDGLSPTRLVASIEMAFVYVALIGVVFLLCSNPKTESLLLVLLSLVFLVIYGLTIGNVGTLYRVRYSFEFLLVLVGVVGWCNFLKKYKYAKEYKC